MKADRKRGNSFGIWCFKVLLKVFGLRASYLLLYPVCLYYLIFDRDAFRKAEVYIEKRFPGAGKITVIRHIYRLFISQGKQLIDRYAHISGEQDFEIKLDSDRLVEVVRESENGALLLTSHIGNWQITMEALRNLDRAVCLVMKEERNVTLRETMNFPGAGNKIRLLRKNSSPELVIDILKKLDEGYPVAIMGDRRYGQKTRQVDFLGEKAHFPYNVFSLASAADCPVVVLFSAKTSLKEYVVEIPSIIYTEDLEEGEEKDGKFVAGLKKYIKELESYVERFPHQCFLFEDVWEESKRERNQ